MYKNNIKDIRIDASSICQLKCPLCPTSKGLNKTNAVGLGFLKFENFKKFINANPNVKMIELSNWGEVFLNPEINDIIKYAYEKKVALTATNGVNFNHVNEDTLKYLVKYKFKFLSISIDGASQEIYSKYRIGGNFNKVIDNIKKINEYKKKFKSRYPILLWQFVKFGHNQHELALAKKTAKKLNMSFVIKDNWDKDYSPVNSNENILINKNKSKKTKNINIDPFFCSYLWTGPQINWDGKLLGCCINYWYDFGNVFDESLSSLINKDIYIHTKNVLLGKEKPGNNFPCINCNVYENLSKNNLYKRLKFYIFISKIAGSMNLGILFYRDFL